MEQLPTDWNKPPPQSAWGRLRDNAITGVLVLAPLAITVFILYKVITWLDSWLVGLVPPTLRPEEILGVYIPGTGLVAGFVLAIFAGFLARNFLGMYLLGLGERIMARIPAVSSLYGAIKQVLETLTASQTDAFREVVLVEYPRKGTWAIGFVTGTTKGEVQRLTDSEMVNVFVPTTPNPTSGFLLFYPKKELVKLDMTVEQGVKMVISGGIVVPKT